MTGVSGKYALIFCSHSGMRKRGKKVPDRNIIGNTIMLASGAAWRSFFAQPPTDKPIPRIKITLNARNAASSKKLPATLRSKTVKATKNINAIESKPMTALPSITDMKYCHTRSGVVCSRRKIPIFLSSGKILIGPKIPEPRMANPSNPANV